MANKCPFHDISNISEFDALDNDARSNPWPYYDWLRTSPHDSVYKLPNEQSFFVVHRYEDVKNILMDSANFSSEVIPTVKSPFFALMDGDNHRRIRNVVSNMFSPKNMQQWEKPVREIIESCTNRLLNTNQPELFDAWADAIPLSTLSLLFGLDRSNHAIKKLHHDAIAINRALFVRGGTGPRRNPDPNFREKIAITLSIIRNAGKLFRLKKLIGDDGMKELFSLIKPSKGKYEAPRPDFNSIPSAIAPLFDIMITIATRMKEVEKNANGDTLNNFMNAIRSKEVTFVEMMMAGAFILFAGYETTASLLSNSFVHLAKHPETFRMLKQNPDKIENFMEECLRFYTPVGRFLRRTRTDFPIGGTVIPANSIVILMLGAANTDSLKFEDACTFNPERPNLNAHLSFGKGTHFCIGAPLARMQVLMALTYLIHKAESLQIDDSTPLQMVVDRDNGILRYEEVRVVVG